MGDHTRLQTWPIVNQEPLEVLETGSRESVDNMFNILDSKINFPFRVSLASNILTVYESEFQTYKTDGSEFGGLENSYRVATSPILGSYKIFNDSTLSFLTGATTGSFAAGVSTSTPALLSGQYIWLAIIASSEGTLNVYWGDPNLIKANAAYPNFPTGTAVCLILLQTNAGTIKGVWGSFNTVISENIVIFKGSGGGGGGGTDFVPSYSDSTHFAIRSTQGRFVLANGRYYGLDHDAILLFDTSFGDGEYFICLNTYPEQASGLILVGTETNYFVMTNEIPGTNNYNPYYAPLGQYQVISGAVDKNSVQGYSTREMISWVYGLPKVRRTSQKILVSGIGTFNHNLNEIPNIINYHYYNFSTSSFDEISRSDVETGFTKNTVSYNLPVTPLLPWSVGDYVLIEVLYYAYSQESGFASPKTDYTTEWFSSTPSNVLAHPLIVRPKNITLEFNDVTNNLYWVEDGNQYVNKSLGGIQRQQVTFDWSALPALSLNFKMRITMSVSKLSAGSFEAEKLQRGTVSVTGNTSRVISPDIVVGSNAQLLSGEATHSSLASVISEGITDGSKILIIGTTGDATPVVITNRVNIEGLGNSANINCNFSLGAGSSKSLIKYVRFAGNLTINNGSNNNIITDCWIVNTGTVVDNNVTPNNLITILQEV